MFKAAHMQNEYTDPVSKLLKHERYELQNIDQPWSDYLALGLSVRDLDVSCRRMEF